MTTETMPKPIETQVAEWSAERAEIAELVKTAAPKAKWAPIDLFAGMPRIAIGSPWHIALSEAERKINQLGAENAKLKNQITKLKGAKA